MLKILFPIGLFHPAKIGGPANTVFWHTSSLNKNKFSFKLVYPIIS